MGLFKKLISIFKKPVKKPVPKPKKKVEVVKPEVKKPPVKRPPVKKKDLREVYKILKEPHISEKATVLTDQNKYVFKIMPRANKVETKKAVENLYGVRVKDVNIINVHRKRRVLRGIEGFKTGYKKAIVTLEEGEKIEIVPR
jgi:large subunit ribosomal protein L23